MSAIPNRCRNVAAELESLAEVIGNLEQERDHWKRQALRWAEVVERQGLSYAERVQLEGDKSWYENPAVCRQPMIGVPGSYQECILPKGHDGLHRFESILK